MPTNRKDMTDEEFGKRLVAVYDQIAELHKSGARDDDARHPMKVINDWQRECRSARDEAGLGPVLIEKHGSSSEEGGSDDVQPKVTGGLGSKRPAQDSFAMGTDGVPRMFLRNGQILEGNAAIEAHSRQSDPARTNAMAGAIKGYRRLA
jgi:hypothetical protein